MISVWPFLENLQGRRCGESRGFLWGLGYWCPAEPVDELLSPRSSLQQHWSRHGSCAPVSVCKTLWEGAVGHSRAQRFALSSCPVQAGVPWCCAPHPVLGAQTPTASRSPHQLLPLLMDKCNWISKLHQLRLDSISLFSSQAAL